MANTVPWKDLPNDVVLKIAGSCGGLHNEVRGVCPAWKRAVEADAAALTIINSALPPNLGVRFPAITKLNLQSCNPPLTPRDLRTLKRDLPPTTATLTLTATPPELTGETLGLLGSLPLASLTLKAAPEELTTELTNALRGLGARLPRLDLELAGERLHFVDTHLRRLARLPIARLDLSGTDVSDSGLAVLRDLPLLRDLDLSGASKKKRSDFSDGGLERLRGLPLTSLNLGGGWNFTDRGLEALRGMRLKSLDLSDCRFSSDGLNVLRRMPLSSLNLSGLEGASFEGLCIVCHLPLTDLGLCSVGVLGEESLRLFHGKPLTKLDLGIRNDFSPWELEFLKDMPLRNLDANSVEHIGGELLQGWPLERLRLHRGDDEQLVLLRGMNLVDLDLSICHDLTDIGIEALRGMPLTRLHIHSAQRLSNSGFQGLRGMALTDLKLHGCQQISDRGLEILRCMPLRRLMIVRCPKTTEQGVRNVAGDAEVFFVPSIKKVVNHNDQL